MDVVFLLHSHVVLKNYYLFLNKFYYCNFYDKITPFEYIILRVLTNIYTHIISTIKTQIIVYFTVTCNREIYLALRAKIYSYLGMLINNNQKIRISSSRAHIPRDVSMEGLKNVWRLPGIICKNMWMYECVFLSKVFIFSIRISNNGSDPLQCRLLKLAQSHHEDQ